MNYPFARAVAAWLFDQPQKIRPSELDRRLRGLRIAYPRAATYVMQNLVDSHDTDRVVSMALNPDRAYDHANRIQDNGPNYNNAKPPAEAYRTARLAALLQMTYVGAPMIYYGDEVGMWGADDPTCRKPMLWEDLQPYEAPDQNFVMKDQLEFYRAAIRLRAEHAALRTGEYRTLLADDENDVFAFLRWNDEEKLIVVLNASDHDHEILVPVPEDSPLVWNGVFGTDKAQFAATGGSTAVVVPAYGGVVLHAAP
jgi:glycosidase